MRSVISHGKQIGLLLASAFVLVCIAKSVEGGYTQQEADVATSTEPAVRLEQPKNRAEAEAQRGVDGHDVAVLVGAVGAGVLP